MAYRFFLLTAVHNLWRGGQRSLIALLCVAFGAMSITAMHTLSDAFLDVMLIDAVLTYGGDAVLYRDSALISEDDLGVVDDLQAAGHLDTYTAQAAQSIIITVTDTADTAFAQGYGVDPSVYPLVGDFAFTDSQRTFAQLLSDPLSVVITRDLELQYDLSVGDALRVMHQETGIPLELQVTGVATDAADRRGGRLYYGWNTARQLVGTDQFLSEVLTRTDQLDALQTAVQAAGWQIFLTPPVVESESGRLFEFMLKGAGVLGLIVGGIGIANTMQVLLERRTADIAILKALGYTQSHLLLLFMVEVSLLGVVGSLLGVIAAVIPATWFLTLLQTITPLLLPEGFSPMLMLLYTAIGTLTTLIFGLYVVVRTREVRPALLLRRTETALRQRQWVKTALLFVVLCLPFTAVTTLIFGTMLEGVGIVLVAIIGFVVLGGSIAAVLWLVLRVLPSLDIGLLHLSKRELQRNAGSVISAMIAIVIGTFTLCLSVSVIFSAEEERLQRTDPLTGANLAIVTQIAEQPTVETALQQRGLPTDFVQYQASAQRIVSDDDREVFGMGLTGRETPSGIVLNDATWGEDPNGVYAPEFSSLSPGTRLRITGSGGEERTVNIVGTYQPQYVDIAAPYIAPGLLMPADLLQALSGEAVRVTYLMTMPEGSLDTLRQQLVTTLPSAAVVTGDQTQAALTQSVNSLFSLGASMAALALLAGVVLIANAVSLAMLERRYEMGVLKAVGFSQRHLLFVILLSYAVIGAIAGGLGVIGAQLFLIIVTTLEPGMQGVFQMKLEWVLSSIGVGIALVLLTAALIARQTTQVRPLAVLRQP